MSLYAGDTAAADAQAVASVVADWTGIPVGRMVKNELEAVLRLGATLGQRVIGQQHGLDMIARRIQTSRAKLDNPNKPIGVFMLANLGVGFTFSTLARNQLQALQLTFFFFLPSMLLSGFMFPFRGMPEWAQWLGSVLPNTLFLRIARGILLKGNGPLEIAPEIWPLLLFLVVAMAIGVKRYRQTLD
mgnify:CR=1 FL=1